MLHGGLRFVYYGATSGSSSACHPLLLPGGRYILEDRGLVQGAETSADGQDDLLNLLRRLPPRWRE